MGDAKKGTKRWDKKLAGNAKRQASKTQKAKVAAHVEDLKKKLRNAKKVIAELKAQLDQANRAKSKWMRKCYDFRRHLDAQADRACTSESKVRAKDVELFVLRCSHQQMISLNSALAGRLHRQSRGRGRR